jgi:hypothetical protein
MRHKTILPSVESREINSSKFTSILLAVTAVASCFFNPITVATIAEGAMVERRIRLLSSERKLLLKTQFLV